MSFLRAPYLAVAIIAASTTGAAASPCATRVKDTAAKLVACITQDSLWAHLAAFQQIADKNPGPDGHGTRDTGQPGYKASVDYVAGLMQAAGYNVTVQTYTVPGSQVTGVPIFASATHRYVIGQDWSVARLSGSGTLTAPVQAAGMQRGAATGCAPQDFTGFTRGNIALVQRGLCDSDSAVANAAAAGAAAVILTTSKPVPAQSGKGSSLPALAIHLEHAANIPVITTTYEAGLGLYQRTSTGQAPTVHLDVRTRVQTIVTDYNLIADSPFGDPNHVVVAEGHLDSIYGAGMLDNASGSVTLLETALQMAKTPTRNQLRYIWFGGEEIGLFGSRHYTKTLPPQDLHRIVFDIDSDVTATPNFAVLIADPQFAPNVKRFPPNVVPGSKIGNRYFADYFHRAGIPVRPASFGNDGTDSNSFSLVGVPNTGILTQQDCCKSASQVKIWGGTTGNYEGDLPSHNGGCVDRAHRWCDNLSNNDPVVLTFISKAFAYVTYKLANDPTL